MNSLQFAPLNTLFHKFTSNQFHIFDNSFRASNLFQICFKFVQKFASNVSSSHLLVFSKKWFFKKRLQHICYSVTNLQKNLFYVTHPFTCFTITIGYGLFKVNKREHLFVIVSETSALFLCHIYWAEKAPVLHL